MKKLIISSLVFVLILFSCVNVFAVVDDIETDTTGTEGTETEVASIPTATASFDNYDLEITASPADAKLGERITVTVKALNLKDVEDGVNTITGTLKYDPEVLSLVEYSGPEGWDRIEFNTETQQFATATTDYTTEDLTILTFVFQPLETAKVGDTSEITLEYLDLANDNDYEVTANAPVVKVKLVEETTDPGTEDPGTTDPGTTDPSGSGTQTPGGSNGQTPSGTNGNRGTYTDGTTATGRLPRAGKQAICISIAGVVLVAISTISLRKYKELKGIK